LYVAQSKWPIMPCGQTRGRNKYFLVVMTTSSESPHVNGLVVIRPPIGPPIGVIVGSILAVVAAVAVGIIIFCLIRRRKLRSRPGAVESAPGLKSS
jgi:hypothetical protein